MSYKALDGAVPASKDLIDFDYISDQPDIPVETWGDSNLLAEGGQGVPTSEVSAATMAVLDGGLDPAHESHQQQMIGVSDEAAGYQDPHAPSALTAMEQHAGGQAGEGGPAAAGGPEFTEYLESQNIFSYDRASTANSTAEAAATPPPAAATAAATATPATAEELLGQGNDPLGSDGGANATATGGAPDLVGPEDWGWSSTTFIPPSEEVQTGNENTRTFGAEIDYDFEAQGAVADNSSVSQGMLVAEADGYVPSTPSYGLDE